MTMRFSRRRAGLGLLFLFLASSAAMVATSVDAAAPDGWFLAGDRRNDYDTGVDKSKVEQAKGFGTLMQTVDAAKYRGKRVRLAAHIKSERLDDWAGLWMRVDGEGNKLLAFDNMESRPIKGSVDWKRYEVVLDVAADAKAVAFGVLLAGKGTVFMNGVAIDPVDKSVPTTVVSAKPEPANLDFDK
jgi:hypothetical protein